MGEVRSPFIDIADKPLMPVENYGDDLIVQAKVFQAGFGNKAMRVDQSGLWLGASRFANAPFRVDMLGNVVASSLTASGYIPTGGAASDVNGNPTTVSGAKVTDGTITAAKINVATLAAISALLGTVDVGGSGNGNGVLNVKDAAGNIKVILDSLGLTINDGKITLKSSNGTTIIDSTGLNSIGNFVANNVPGSASFSTTSISYVDVTGMILSFTLSRSTKVMFGATVKGYSPDSSPTNLVTPLSIIDLDGLQIGGEMTTPSIEETAGKYFTTASTTTIETVGAGSHTIKIRLKSSSGGNVTLSGPRVLWYVVLGT